MKKSSTKMKPLVDEMYKSILPRPDETRREMIKQSLIDEGQHETIKYSDLTGKIVDGYTRLDILDEIGVKPKYELKHFDTEDDEMMYALSVNVNRRQMNTFQMFESVNRFRDMIHKKVVKEGMEFRKKHGKPNRKESERRPFYTNFRIGKMIGAHGHTVEHMVVLSKYASKDLLERVRAGEIDLTSAYKQVQEERRQNNEPMMMKYSSLWKDNREKISKKVYRNDLGITMSILDGLSQDDMIISAISRHSNLSHYAAVKRCKPLLESGLVTKVKDEGLTKYKLTNDGIMLFEEFKKFSDHLEKYNLEGLLFYDSKDLRSFGYSNK